MSKTDETFKALADASRRDILYLLAVTPNGLSMNEVAKHFPFSRQGVAKHLAVLENAGLIRISARGRERNCQLNPLPLQEVLHWLEFYRNYWDDRFNELQPEE